MTLLATFKLALRALGRNKMRSLLTMLGIIIGVGAVIAMVGIGQGASASIQSQIAQLGNNMLYVSSGSSNSAGTRGSFGSGTTLTADDVEAIANEIPSSARTVRCVRRARPRTAPQSPDVRSAT